MKNIIFFLSSIILIMSSCVDKSNIEELTSNTTMPEMLSMLNPQEYFVNLYNSKKGEIGILNHKGASGSQSVMTNGYEGSYVDAAFYDSTNTRIPQGNLTINGITLTPDQTNKYYSSTSTVAAISNVTNIYGTTVDIQVEDAQGNPFVNDSLYVPQALYVTQPDAQTDDTISTTTQIIWNADPLNKNDVFILIDFHPYESGNESFPFYDAYYKLIHTEDDGSYTLSSNEFGSIPDGARVSIRVGRGNYKEALDANNDTVVLYGISMVSLSLFIDY